MVSGIGKIYFSLSAFAPEKMKDCVNSLFLVAFASFFGEFVLVSRIFSCTGRFFFFFFFPTGVEFRAACSGSDLSKYS